MESIKPITDKEILKNVTTGSKKKKIGEDGKKYYYIYKVVNEKTGLTFVSGCMSDIDPDKDNHISKSILGRNDYKKQKSGVPGYGSHIRNSKPGEMKRTDLLFLNNLSELIEVEKQIITQEFKVDPRTMNYRFQPQYEQILKFAGDFITKANKESLAAIMQNAGQIAAIQNLHTEIAQISTDSLLNPGDK